MIIFPRPDVCIQDDNGRFWKEDAKKSFLALGSMHLGDKEVHCLFWLKWVLFLLQMSAGSECLLSGKNWPIWHLAISKKDISSVNCGGTTVEMHR